MWKESILITADQRKLWDQVKGKSIGVFPLWTNSACEIFLINWFFWKGNSNNVSNDKDLQKEMFCSLNMRLSKAMSIKTCNNYVGNIKDVDVVVLLLFILPLLLDSVGIVMNACWPVLYSCKLSFFYCGFLFIIKDILYKRSFHKNEFIFLAVLKRTSFLVACY